MKKAPVIYEYLNYRLFVKEWISWKKSVRTGFSQRALLQKMGITSTGFIANVLSGRNNFTIEQVEQLSQIMALSPKESAYFINLLLFSRADNPAEQNQHYRMLMEYRRGKAVELGSTMDELFAQWYFPVVKVLIDGGNVREDYASIASKLEPPISPAQAKHAVELLIRIGLVVREPEGLLKSVDSVLTTGDTVHSRIVVLHQQAMMDLAKRAQEKLPPEDREVSGVTVTLSERSMQLVQDEIRRFRRKILQIAEDDAEPNRVVRCNIQMFPLAYSERGENA